MKPFSIKVEIRKQIPQQEQQQQQQSGVSYRALKSLLKIVTD